MGAGPTRIPLYPTVSPCQFRLGRPLSPAVARPTIPVMPPMPALLGTYAPPTVKVGDRIRCLYRNRLCVVSGWTAGPLAWPTGHPIKGSGGGGTVIPAAVVRAVRTEPYEALMGALGVSQGTVFNWRRRFGAPAPRPRPPRPPRPKPPGFQEEQTRRAVELGVKPQ